MLSDKDAVATIAVKSLESARKFYEQTLGLTKIMENEEVLAFKSGSSTLFVYRSQYAGTNKATAVTWVADEVEDIVKTLKGRGVSFEHYDLPNMTRQGARRGRHSDSETEGEQDRAHGGLGRLCETFHKRSTLTMERWC